MAKREELYKWIKISGMLSFIPVVLVVGPLAGYALAEYLRQKFVLGFFILPLCIGIGILVSAIEAVRILRLALKSDRKK